MNNWKHEILKKPFLAELENEKTNTSKSKKGKIREYIYQHASRAGKWTLSEEEDIAPFSLDEGLTKTVDAFLLKNKNNKY